MGFLAHLIQMFSSASMEARARADRERYLAKATDLHDLEFRIRKLDRTPAKAL